MLTIKKNTIDVPVAQLTLLNGKEVMVLGDYERDLILRTKGSLRVQIQNKFFDLISDSDKTTLLGTDSFVISDNLGSLALTAKTVIFNETEGKLYYFNGDTISPIGAVETTDIVMEDFVSYTKEQKIANRLILHKNIALAVPSVDELYNDSTLYEASDSIYFKSLKKHYHLEDVTRHRQINGWIESYLSLQGGGSVNGRITVLTKVDVASLTLESNNSSFIGKTNGLFIGESLTLKGLQFRNHINDFYFETLNKNSIININTLSSENATINLIKLQGSKIAINDDFSYKTDLNINLSSTFRKNIYIQESLMSTDYTSTFIKSLNYKEGFGLSKNGTYHFEVDSLLIKNPESQHKITIGEEAFYPQTSFRARSIFIEYELPMYITASVTGRYGSTNLNDPIAYIDRGVKLQIYDTDTSLFVTINTILGIGDRNSSNNLINPTTYDYNELTATFAVPTGDYSFDAGTNTYIENPLGTLKYLGDYAKVKISFYDITGLQVNDLLLCIEQNKNRDVEYGGFLRILNITLVNGLYEVYAEAFNTDLVKFYTDMHFIKVGNTSNNIACKILHNNTDYTLFGVNTFNELFKYYYNPYYYINEKAWFTKINPELGAIINLSGNLFSAYADINFPNMISNPLTTGLYSNNAYIKGEIVPSRMVLGTELTWSGGILSIAQLEVVKNRVTALELNPYVHPNFTAFTIDTSNAQIIDLITTTSQGHISNITLRTLTLSNLGYTGATNANFYTHPNHSGDIVSVADGATTIQAGVVTYAKIQNVTADRILGRVTTAGTAQELTATQVRTLINVADGANAYTHPSKTWIDKTTLVGAVVISNLTIDSLGHPTNWTTRSLTLADLGYTGATNADNYSSWLIAASGTAGTGTVASGNTLTLTAGSNVTITRSLNNVTINSSFTNTTYSNGSGIDLVGTVFSHTDTSLLTGAQGGSGIAGFTLDGFGHVTAVTTASYYLASNPSGYISSLAHSHGVANSAGTQQFVFAVNENIRFAGSGGTSVSFDAPTKTVTITSSTTGTVASSLTFNNGGAGGASGSTFNGSSALTISYNTVGAPSTTGANASGTWPISVSGFSMAVGSGSISDLNTAWTLPGSSISNGLYLYRYDHTATNKPVALDNANWLMNIYSHPSGNVSSYGHQLAAGDTNDMYFRQVLNGSFGSWNKFWHTGNLPEPFSTTSGNAILPLNRYFGSGTGNSNTYFKMRTDGSMDYNVPTGKYHYFMVNGSIVGSFQNGELNTNGVIATGAPYGTSHGKWKLGIAEVAVNPFANRTIRVQIGDQYYDILAANGGTVPV